MKAMNFIFRKKNKNIYTENLVYSFREFTNPLKSYYPGLRTPNVHIQVNDRFWIRPKY